MHRPQKEQAVTGLTDRLQRTVAAVVVEFRGLNVEQATQLRRRLGEQGVEFKVIKNTLLSRAAKEVGVEGLDELLKGPNAIAFSYSDPVVAARSIQEYVRTNRGTEVAIKGGLLEGKVIGMEVVRELADLPSREVLLARVAGGMKSPIAGLATVLSAPLRGLAYGMKALADQKTAESA